MLIRYQLLLCCLMQVASLEAQDSVKIYHELGQSAQSQGDYGQAIRYYAREIFLDSTKPEAFWNRGICYRAIKAYSKSLADFSKAMQLVPSVPLYPWERAITYYEMGEYEKAINDYNICISLTNVTLLLKRYYLERGIAEIFANRNQKAVYSLTYAMEADYYKLDWQPFYWRGVALYNLKKYELAIVDYDLAEARFKLSKEDSFPDYNYKILALQQLKK